MMSSCSVWLDSIPIMVPPDVLMLIKPPNVPIEPAPTKGLSTDVLESDC